MSHARFMDKMLRYGLEYFGLYYGIYRAEVLDVEDDKHQGRIRVRVPALSGAVKDNDGVLAYPKFPFFGSGYGGWWMPEVGDLVYVVFENGNPEVPVWDGGWPGEDEAPEDFRQSPPKTRGFVTPSGHKVTFDDENNQVTVAHKDGSYVILNDDGDLVSGNKKGSMLFLKASNDQDQGGQASLIDEYGSRLVLREAGADITDKHGNVICTSSSGVSIIAQGDVAVQAEGAANINAGSVSLGSGAAEGVIKADTFLGMFKVLLTALAATSPTFTAGTSGVAGSLLGTIDQAKSQKVKTA